MVNLTAEQARAQIILMGGRVMSARETLTHLVAQEPRLKAYTDYLDRGLRALSWEIRQAGENVELLYLRIWPEIDLPPMETFDIVTSVEPAHVKRFTNRPR